MPSIQTLILHGCEDADRFFREGREYFNPIYVQKLATLSTFFTRIPAQAWIPNTGTVARGFRLGRQWYDPTKPWKLKISERCESNSCDSAPEMIQRAGTQSYTYALAKKELQTEWICVEDLLHRLMPVEEIMQFEVSNAIITKHVNEEFLRQNYVGASGNKWAGFADSDNLYCGNFDNNAWFMPPLAEPNYGYDTNYVYVKADPTLPDGDPNSLSSVAQASLDLLDDVLIDLNDEDDAYRLDITEANGGIPLLDVLVPDPQTGRDLWFQSKQNYGYWDSTAGFSQNYDLRRLGITTVIGNYAFSYDRDALRYNVDTAYNTALVNSVGYAFDANDTATWPRLIRVPRYIKQQVEIGCEYIPNPDYRNADFAILPVMVEKGMVKHYMPNGMTGYGSVRMEEQDYAGNFEWKRPDWECNPNGKMGFFRAEFQLSAEIKDPTVMNSILVRRRTSKTLTGSCCPLKTYTPTADPDCWACEGIGTP